MLDFLAVFLDYVVKRIASIGGSKNRAASWQDAGDRFHGQRNGPLRPDQAVKAVIDADHAPAVAQNRRADRAANHRVQAGAISPAVGDADGLDCLGLGISAGRRLTSLERKNSFYTIRDSASRS